MQQGTIPLNHPIKQSILWKQLCGITCLYVTVASQTTVKATITVKKKQFNWTSLCSRTRSAVYISVVLGGSNSFTHDPEQLIWIIILLLQNMRRTLHTNKLTVRVWLRGQLVHAALSVPSTTTGMKHSLPRFALTAPCVVSWRRMATGSQEGSQLLGAQLWSGQCAQSLEDVKLHFRDCVTTPWNYTDPLHPPPGSLTRVDGCRFAQLCATVRSFHRVSGSTH